MSKADILAKLVSTGEVLADGTITPAELGLGNVENKSSTTIRGEITSSNVTTALGFTPYDATNPSGFITSSGTAANVTGTVAIANGGTGATTRQAAMDALAGSVTAGQYLRGDGTDVVMSSIQATDIPSLDAAKITTGTIDAARLPSYVDDVIEAANLAGFPATGETGKIYVALDTNKVYRWSGSVYIYITSGAVDSVAGKTGVVTLTSSDVGLGNVENKSSTTIRDELTSGNVTTALGYTPLSNATSYLPLSGGTLTGLLTLNRTAGLRGIDAATNDNYVSMRVVANNTPSGANSDGMYIGYQNGNSGVTRIFGGGAASGGIVVSGSGPNDVTIAGSIALHTNNYNSYSPTLTGTGASGTWGINISGSAATNSVSTAVAPQKLPSAYPTFRTTYENSANFPGLGDWYSAITVRGRENFAWQIIGPSYDTAYGSDENEMYVRAGSGTSWSPVRQLIHSGNVGFYSPTLTGTGASGTWNINIAGSASTATNVAYSGLTGTVPTWNQNTTGNAATATTAANVVAGADAAIVNQQTGSGNVWFSRIISRNSTTDRTSFLGVYSGNAGVFAHNSALTAWADLYINTVDGSGGGTVRMPSSVLVNGSQVLHAGNYNSYAPTLTGTGASGTWGINITGAAASAVTLSNNATISGLNFGGVLALTASGASTGNATGARLTESYGPQWNLGDSATWHYQILNGSLLVGISAGGTNYGSGNIRAAGEIYAGTSNLVLHAGNFNSYALPLSGGTLSGTLIINSDQGVRVFRDGSSGVASHLYFANAANSRAYNWQLDENNNAALWGYGGDWTKLLSVSSSGALNTVGAITQAGNQVLHAGNYNSYSIPRSEFRSFGDIYIDPNGQNANCTTAQFMAHLASLGFFNYSSAVGKCVWSYAGNNDLTDTGFGTIDLAGCVIETWKSGNEKHVRLTRPTTGAGGYQVLVYVDHGSGYSPGWRAFITSENIGSQSVSYATSAGSATDSTKLPLSGGTISGALAINSGAAYTLQLSSSQRYQFRIRNTAASSQNAGWWFAHDNGGNLVVHADSVGDVASLTNSGTFNATNLTVNGNQVLHAGNINSYIPSWSTGVNGSHIVQRDGNGYIYANHINFNTSESENPTINSFITGNGDGWSRKSSLQHVKNSIRGVADGTWGINISGSAETVDGIDSSRMVYGSNLRKSNNDGNMNNTDTSSGFWYASSPTGGPFGDWTHWINCIGADWNPNYGYQLAHAFHSDSFAVRRVTNGSWSGWRNILTDSNYNSYSPTLTGGGASGTWGINITGTANNITAYTINQNLGTGNQPTFDSVITNNNGNGTNIRLGDDVWLGDCNLANTFRIRGSQDAAAGFIVFGSDTTQLGRTGAGALTWGGNAILNAGNYGNYALALFGTTLSISDWNTLTAFGSRRTGPDGVDTNGPPINQYGNLLVFGGDSGVTQLQAGHDGRLAWRTKWNAADWTGWQIALDSGNYNSYAPTLTGSGASGTWGINVTGSAGSVPWSGVTSRPSNIMYYQGFTLDANTMDSNATGFTYSNNAPYTGPVARFSTGGGYDLWLNSPYSGGGNGLAFRTRNGDISTLNPWRQVLHDNNYNSYSPTLTGGGASGTWGINITGSAASLSANLPVSRLNSGTSASASTFWRGDGTWAAISAAVIGTTTQVAYNNAGTMAGSANLTFNGTNLTCGGTITANSDESLKTNWRDFSADFVEQLATVKHGTYDRVDVDLTQDGVSAQSLQPLLPFSVLAGEDGKLSVAYGNAALVSAIELAKRVVAQDEKIARLEALVEQLINKV